MAHGRPPADITKAFAGQSALSRSVISFPDQLVGSGSANVMIPFLGTRYCFSAFDALLVARHRPPVYALATRSGTCDFALHEVRYSELFTVDGRLLSLPGLVRRLLMYLEQELTQPRRTGSAGLLPAEVRGRAVAASARRANDVGMPTPSHLQSRTATGCARNGAGSGGCTPKTVRARRVHLSERDRDEHPCRLTAKSVRSSHVAITSATPLMQRRLHPDGAYVAHCAWTARCAERPVLRTSGARFGWRCALLTALRAAAHRQQLRTFLEDSISTRRRVRQHVFNGTGH